MSCVPADQALAAAALRANVSAADDSSNNGGPESGGGGDAAGALPGAYPHCDREKLLPCFLTFADYDVPLQDFSNMRCFPVLRKPAAVAAADCGLGDAFVMEDDQELRETYEWSFPPSYYQFHDCHCMAGYRDVWTRNHTMLTCEPASKGSALPPWTWVLVALGVAIALLAGAIVMVGSKWMLFRSKWAREVSGGPAAPWEGLGAGRTDERKAG